MFASSEGSFETGQLEGFEQVFAFDRAKRGPDQASARIRLMPILQRALEVCAATFEVFGLDKTPWKPGC